MWLLQTLETELVSLKQQSSDSSQGAHAQLLEIEKQLQARTQELEETRKQLQDKLRHFVQLEPDLAFTAEEQRWSAVQFACADLAPRLVAVLKKISPGGERAIPDLLTSPAEGVIEIPGIPPGDWTVGAEPPDPDAKRKPEWHVPLQAVRSTRDADPVPTTVRVIRWN